MTGIAIIFSSNATANHLVAGVPAAARAAHRASLCGKSGTHGVIVVPGGWSPSRWCESEMRRLAPGFRIETTEPDFASAATTMIVVHGEALITTSNPATLLGEGDVLGRGNSRARLRIMTAQGVSLKQQLTKLNGAGRAIIAATGKPTDGIVSRYVNRPISQTLTRALLLMPGVQPLHATMAAAAIGIVMALCLMTGGSTGLIAGAILYQTASIVDGVDGEIARATLRSSSTGALIDSITDAATNLAFIGGVTLNLWFQGLDGAAMMGALGLLILITGLCAIGAATRARGGPFTFDLVKQAVNARRSMLMQWLTWLTMRDFFAAAGAVLIILDLAAVMLALFTIAASAWLVVTLTVLARPLVAAAR